MGQNFHLKHHIELPSRRKLAWGIIDYTTYKIVLGVVGMTAQYIAIPLLSEKLKLRDSTIIIIDITGCFIQTVILSIATATWMVYLGGDSIGS